MLNHIIRRVLATLPVMAFVALFVFSLLSFSTGDPAALIAGEQASVEQIEQVREDLGLNEPFFTRFASWSGRILVGDFGESIFSNKPVLSMIAQRVEPSASLMLLTLVIAVVVAIPLGTLAAWKAGSLLDRCVMAGAVLGFSIPVFVLGYLLAYVFAVRLHWLPVQGYNPISSGLWPWLQNIILPSLALSGAYIALIARITRATIVEVLRQDYIRTARAKGVGNRALLFVHALKNAGIPIITVIGIGVAVLISGTVITESVFAIPGLGQLTVDSILRRDYPVIQGLVLLFSFSYVLINLLVDLSYSLFDPRIRY